MMQAAMSVAVVLFSYLLARRMSGWQAGIVCGALVATNPFISNMAVYLLSETSFTFLMLAAGAMSLRATDEEAPLPWSIAAGLCWGLCSLVRPTTEFFLPMLLAGTLLLPSWHRWRRPAAVATLAFALVMAPCMVRNHGVPDVPGHSIIVNSIVQGSYPDFMYEGDPKSRGFPYRFDPAARESEHDLGSAVRHVAGLFAQHPWRYTRWYLLGKPFYFLSLEDVQSLDIQIYELGSSPWYERTAFRVVAAASRALHWPATLLALAACVLLAWRRMRERLTPVQQRAAILAALLLGYAIALHMVVAPFPRYAIPFRPLMYALALLALATGWRYLRNRA
jgi:4-amino-4-deoxy-L-arabinose transferase-like glycosyltransferase